MAQPTYVGGTINGYTDGRALDVHLGVWVGSSDATGAYVATLYPDGTPTGPDAGYSWIDKLNPTVAAGGTTDPAATNVWGACVSSAVTRFDVEVYPKAPQDPDPTVPQVTDKSRYASVAYYRGAVTPGTSTNLALRVPVVYQDGGGNTGGLQGYITYNGAYVPASAITRVRAFPGDGAACGIRGFSAAADQLTTASGPDRTYYRMDYLVAGQCGSVAQHYSLQLTCHLYCGATDRDFKSDVAIKRGITPRFDIHFTSTVGARKAR
jgi:hypothetical protein